MPTFQDNIQNLKAKFSTPRSPEQLKQIEKELKKNRYSDDKVKHWFEADTNLRSAVAEQNSEQIDRDLSKIASHQEGVINLLLDALLSNRDLSQNELTQYFTQTALVAGHMDTQPLLEIYVQGAIAEIKKQKIDPLIEAQYRLLRTSFQEAGNGASGLTMIEQSVKVIDTAQKLVKDSPNKKNDVVAHLNVTETLVREKSEEAKTAYIASVNALHGPSFEKLLGGTIALVGLAGVVLSGIIGLAGLVSTIPTGGVGTIIGTVVSTPLSIASTALMQKGISLFNQATQVDNTRAEISADKLRGFSQAGG